MASFLMYVLVAVAFFFMGSSDPITCESLNEDLELNLDCEEVNSSDKVVEKLNEVYQQLKIDKAQMESRIEALEMRPTLPATQPRVNVNTTGNEDLSLTCSANVPIGWNVTFSLMTPTNKTILLEDVTSTPNGTWSAVFNVPDPVPSNLTGNFTCVMRASSINDSSSFSTQWTIPVMVYVPLSIKLQKSDTATAGDKMNIMCSISGNPLPKKVTWKVMAHDETSFSDITAEDNYEESVLIEDVECPPVRVFQLTIKKFDEKMSGDTYKCLPQDVDNTLAGVPPTIEIEVEPKRLVTFNCSQTPDPVEVGGVVEVMCKATADGKKVRLYTWTDGNGTEITPYNTKSDGVFVLSVNESKLDESKVVFCIVSVVLEGGLKQEKKNYTVLVKSSQDSPNDTSSSPIPAENTAESTTEGTTEPPTKGTTESTTPTGNSVGITAIVVAVVVILVLCGAVYLAYWKRHALRAWLMEKDVVKVMNKGKRGKGYKYTKLPKDVSTSMKHLE